MKNAIFLATVLLAGAATSASAGVFKFSYTAAGGPSGTETGTVTLTTANHMTSSTFQVLGASGVADGSAITALSPYAAADNLLFPAPSYVDLSGISFSTAAAGNFNLYNNGGRLYVLSSNADPVGYPSNGSPVTGWTVRAVPEPSSLSLMIGAAGILGAAMVVRRRMRGAPASA